MPRPLLLGPALAAALLLAACGGSNPKLIPEERAQRLSDTADQIAQRTSDEDCTGAQSAVGRARSQVAELPRRVDRDLRANLDDWLDQIAGRIPEDCRPAQEEETATPSPEETETPTPTPSKTPTPTATATASPTPEGGDEQESPPGLPPVQPPDTGGVAPGDENG